MKATIKIPVVYAGHSGRSKAEKLAVASVDHEIELRRVHEGDAPIAMRAVLHERVFEWVDYRLHAGKLYRKPFRAKTDGDFQVANRMEAVRSDIWRRASEHVAGSPDQTVIPKARFSAVKQNEKWAAIADRITAGAGNLLPLPGFDEAVSTWRLNADEVAARQIVVNDRPYELYEEPLYKVDFEHPKHLEFPLLASSFPYAIMDRSFAREEIGVRDRIQFAAYFGPDEEEMAMDFLESRRQPGSQAVPNAVRIEKWIDSYLCTDMASLETDRMAKMLLNEISWGITLRSRSRPVILDEDASELVESLMALRQSVVSGHPKTGLDPDIDIAMERVMEAAVGGARTRPYLRPHVRDAATYAIERWRDRPVLVPASREGLSPGMK